MTTTTTGRRTRGHGSLLITMCVGYFFVLLDSTVINVALPSMASQLHVAGPSLSWVVTGYQVPFAALLLLGGTLGDRIGHRPVVLAGLAVFGLASIGCALSPALGWLVLARAVQGVGAALLLPGTLAVLVDAYREPAARARAIGVWAAVGGSALPAGPVLGGVLVQAFDWPAVFWLNVPLVFGAIVAAAKVLPAKPGQRDRRPDVVGTALGAVGLALLVYTAAESRWLVAIPALLALAGFVWWERRLAEPALPLRLFRDRRFALCNAGAVVMNASCQGMLYLLTQLLQRVQRFDPLHAGLAALPAFLPLACVPLLAGAAVARLGPLRVAAVAMAVNGAGVGLLAIVERSTGYPIMAAVLFVWGVGVGLLVAALVAGAVSGVPPSSAGLASAVNNTARQAGGSIGVASASAIAGPATAAGFVDGFHVAALAMASVCVIAVVVLAFGARDRRFAAQRSIAR